MSKYDQSEQRVVELENKVKEMEYESARKCEALQQASASSHEELESLKRDKDLFNMETEVCMYTGCS